MNNSQYEAAFRKVIDEAFNKGNYSVLRDIFNPDFIEHQFGLHATIEGMQADIEGLRRAFPDFHVTVEDIVVDGDKLWARSSAHGTNSGGFMGPPNGKSFNNTVYDQVRFKEGKIVEHWGVPDRFATIVQLGMLPKKP
jgi:predicted ester cyclase